MRKPFVERSITNEIKYPNIVELEVPSEGLDIELTRNVIRFHKSRQIEPRLRRIAVRNKQIYYRWCFSDLMTASAFHEKFGGTLSLSNNGSH
jgi:hypothetical protein